jgi:nascent polypeptide-associated complex subunit alpha
MTTIEEIPNNVEDGPPDLEDAPPTLEEATNDTGADQEASGEQAGEKKQSKYEKKNKKALAKAGLKPFSGVQKVQIKSNGKTAFVIDDPEVYRGGNSDTWIVFGTPKQDDSASRQQQLLQQLMKQQQSQPNLQDEISNLQNETKTEDEEEGDVDETGLVASEIELVMKNANVSRAKAVREIKKHNGDIVNTIMDLQKLSV